MHLEQKQDSETAIKEYLKVGKRRKSLAKDISKITEKILEAPSLGTFNALIEEHESIMAHALKKVKVKEERFPSFKGCMKSLGAWGGDFALVTSTDAVEDLREYFTSVGYPTILTFDEMIFKSKS